MTKLDLTNKVSPCCKKKIKYHEIAHTASRLGFDYYTCSYCEGQLTRTQVLRANIEEDKPIQREDKLSRIEERLEKLEAKFKVDKYQEMAKIRNYIVEELDKFDNKKVQFNDKYRIQSEVMRMVQDLVTKLDEE
jgi:DNA repair exonuclease SbcCD ATPase subunit